MGPHFWLTPLGMSVVGAGVLGLLFLMKMLFGSGGSANILTVAVLLVGGFALIILLIVTVKLPRSRGTTVITVPPIHAPPIRMPH